MIPVVGALSAIAGIAKASAALIDYLKQAKLIEAGEAKAINEALTAAMEHIDEANKVRLSGITVPEQLEFLQEPSKRKHTD